MKRTVCWRPVRLRGFSWDNRSNARSATTTRSISGSSKSFGSSIRSFVRHAALRRFVDGTRDIEYAELVNEDFAGEASDPDDALIFYELRNGLTKVAYPVFTDGTAIPTSGYVSEVNRRNELGRLMLRK